MTTPLTKHEAVTQALAQLDLNSAVSFEKLSRQLKDYYGQWASMVITAIETVAAWEQEQMPPPAEVEGELTYLRRKHHELSERHRKLTTALRALLEKESV